MMVFNWNSDIYRQLIIVVVFVIFRGGGGGVFYKYNCFDYNMFVYEYIFKSDMYFNYFFQLF